MKRPLVAISALGAAALLAACGGGASSNFIGPSPAPSSQSATVAFSITIPPAPSGPLARHAQFNAPSSTQSISIVLTSSNGSTVSGTSKVANLSSSASGCTSASGLTCVVDVVVPAGTDIFAVSTFSQPNAQGSTTGAGTVSVNAQAGTTTNAPTTLNGTIASLGLSLLQSIPEGQPGSVPLVIQAKDSSGNVILGTYTSPIALTITDASKHTTLSGASVADSTAASGVKVSYDGGVMTAGAAISAAVSGVDSSKITGTTFAPDAHQPTTGTFSYADVFTGGPNATPTPMGTITIGYTNNASFNNLSGLVEMSNSEVFSDGSTSGVSNSYYQWALGASNLFEYVGFSNVSSSDSYTNKCQAPYAVLYATNAQMWAGITGAGPCAFTDTGSTFTNSGVSNADGSSTQSSTSTNGSNTLTSMYIVNKDGTAVSYSSRNLGTSYVTAIYTPAPNASTIPVYNYSTPGPLPSPFPSPGPANTTEPNFYATAGLTNGQPPQPLLQDQFTNVGTATLPSQCPVSAAILGANPSITEYDEKYTAVNPFFGVNVYNTKNYLLNGVGLACVVINTASYSSNYSGTSTEVEYLTASSLQAMLKQNVSFAQALPQAGLALAARVHEMRQLRESRELRSLLTHR